MTLYLVDPPGCRADFKLLVYELPVARCYLYRMGLSDDPVEIIAWDTDEAIVESTVDHSQAVPSSKRGEWRFLARFKDSGPDSEDDVWISWHKASELPALGRYSKEHPDLNIRDNQRNPADRRQSAPPRAPKGRGFFQVLLRKAVWSW